VEPELRGTHRTRASSFALRADCAETLAQTLTPNPHLGSLVCNELEWDNLKSLFTLETAREDYLQASSGGNLP